MARRSRSTGVGRGNGAGSAQTQFKDGLPSGNPRGRPPKQKEAVPRTLSEAVSAALNRSVVVTENNREKTMPQVQAMIELVMAEFPQATFFGKMRFLAYLTELGMNDSEYQRPVGSEQAIHDLVQALAEEARRDEEYRRSLPNPQRRPY